MLEKGPYPPVATLIPSTFVLQGGKNLVRQTRDCGEFQRGNSLRRNTWRMAARRESSNMADDSRPFRSYGRHDREHIRRQYQERLKAYHGWVHGSASAGPWLANRLNEHLNDAITLVSQVRQARNLQDVLRLRSAFVHKKIDMLAGSARALTDVLASARPAVRSVKQVSQYQSHVEETARNSPRYEAPERVDSEVREWRARSRYADNR
jgi:hypothetical protein